MQFSCDRRELLAAAKRTAKAAPSSSTITALTGVLLCADADSYELTLTATNLDICIRCTVAAPVTEGGCVVINAALLVNMLTLLEGQTVEMKTQSQSLLSVTGGSTCYLIPILPAGQFPAVSVPELNDDVTISKLRGLVKQTLFATAKSGNPAMQCIKLEVRQNSIRAIGCDGNILASARREIEGGNTMLLLLPSSSLTILAGLVGDEDILTLSASDKQAVFRSADQNMVFTTRLGTGSYLDADSILSGFVGRYEAIVDGAEFRRALEGSATLSHGGTSYVRMVFSLGEISLSCETELGSSRDAIPAQVLTAMPAEGFYYQGKRLLQGVQSMSGPIRLSVSDSGILQIATKEQTILQPANRKPVAKPDKKSRIPKKTKDKKTKEKAA